MGNFLEGNNSIKNVSEEPLDECIFRNDALKKFYSPLKNKLSECSSFGFSRSSEDGYNTDLISSPLIPTQNHQGETDSLEMNSEVMHKCDVLRPLNPQRQLPNSYCQMDPNIIVIDDWNNHKFSENLQAYHNFNMNMANFERPIGGIPMSLPDEEMYDFATTSRPPVTASQIIAKPAGPWCWGLCDFYGRSSTGIVNPNNPEQSSVPICILFLIFLVVSIFVVSGIMVYLKSGRPPI